MTLNRVKPNGMQKFESPPLEVDQLFKVSFLRQPPCRRPAATLPPEPEKNLLKKVTI
jgi:hypothetical protein